MYANKKNWPRLTAALLGCSILAVSPAHAVVVVDLFTTAQSLTTPNAPSSVSDLSGTSIFGGDRELVVGKASGNNNLNANVASGQASISPVGGIDVDQGFARFIWDGAGGSAGVVDFGGTAYDITQGGVNDRWLMTFRTNSGIGGSSFWSTSVSLYTDASNWISYSVSGPSFPGSGTFNGIGSVFTETAGTTMQGTVNFSQIRAIVLQLTEPRSFDENFYIDVLGLYFLNNTSSGNGIAGFNDQTTLFTPAGSDTGSGNNVPEPGMLSLVAAGLLAAAAGRRKRRTS